MKFIARTMQQIFGRKPEAELSGDVVQKSVSLFVLHCLGLALGFLLNFIMVRYAGAAHFGAYAYVFNLLTLLAGFSTVGTETLVLSKVPRLLQDHQYGQLKGLFLFSIFFSAICVLLISLVINFVPVLHDLIKTKMRTEWIIVAVSALFLLSVSAIAQAGLQAMSKAISSQVVEKLIRPVFLIFVIPIWFLKTSHVSADTLIGLNIFSILASVLILAQLNLKAIPKDVKSSQAIVEGRIWLMAAGSFFLVNIMSTLNSRVDILILGMFRDNTEIGMYSIATRVSELLRFSLTILNFILAPLIVKMYNSDERMVLQNLLIKSARVVLVISTVLLLVIVIFSNYILSLFDVSYVGARSSLLVLCMGQMINVFFGSVGMVLLMSGNQRYALISLTAGTLLNVTLCFWLIPIYGMKGAAVASATGLMLWNLLMYIFVRKRTGLKTTAIGWL